MSDEKTYSKADIDKLTNQVSALTEQLDAEVAKRERAVAKEQEARKKLNAATEVDPNEHNALLDKYETLKTEHAELGKQVKTLTKERDTATELTRNMEEAGKKNALNSFLSEQASKLNVLPALLKGFRAEHSDSFVVERNEDGSFAVKHPEGVEPDKYFGDWSGGEIGKSYIAAMQNSGGGAPGGAGNSDSGPNPFAKETRNLTEQSKLVRENPTKAKELAAAAGATLSG